MAVVVAVATPALAHHPIVSGRVVCAENDQQVITWTLTHSSRTGSDMVIEAIVLSRGTLVGISVGQRLPAPPAPGSTVTGTSTYPGDATGRVVLTVTGRWVDENGEEVIPDEKASATVDLVGPCVESTTTTTAATTTTTAATTTTTAATTTTTAATTTTTTAATTTSTAATTTTTTGPSERTQVAGVLVERTPSPAPAQGLAAAPAQVPAAAPATVSGTSAAAAAPDQLPRTGSGTAALSGLGMALVGAGMLFTRASRPKRRLLTRI